MVSWTQATNNNDNKQQASNGAVSFVWLFVWLVVGCVVPRACRAVRAVDDFSMVWLVGLNAWRQPLGNDATFIVAPWTSLRVGRRVLARSSRDSHFSHKPVQEAVPVHHALHHTKQNKSHLVLCFQWTPPLCLRHLPLRRRPRERTKIILQQEGLCVFFCNWSCQQWVTGWLFTQNERVAGAVSYTHLTLPTIYSV